MSRIKDFFSTIWHFLITLVEGFQALFWLLIKGTGVLSREGKAGLRGFLTAPSTQVMIFQFMRGFWPNLSLGRKLIKSYDNTGTAVVTRRADVLDVLNRNEDFEVVYEPRMRKLTDGDNFFLGMQPGWDYTRDTSSMRLAGRMTDVPEIVLPRAQKVAAERVAASGGVIDLPQDLTLHVPWDMTATYFGVGGTEAEMQDWTTTLFWYLFGDLGADPDLDAKAMRNAAAMRAYLDGAVAKQKASPDGATTILSRCLALQAAGTPGMSDLGIRNNLLGILIGAIPTISKASCLALDELLRRPEMLRRTQRAAIEGDDATMANCIWEALRFNPHNPVVYRRARRNTVVGKGTLRQTRIDKGQMVFAATLSAMFDRYEIPNPKSFRTDRLFSDYIIWGYGLHTCYGAAINEAVIPAVLKPLLQKKGLRRAEGDKGQIDTGGTPFPQHFHCVFDT
ncbi:cytochrome P450 [Loktanella agnita]|uniref:cytochrome P450 n=1 Tax=Loktanella agnita TaxID=287097 RepID=UPI003986862F